MLTISRYTLLELVRRRLVLAVILSSLAMLALSGWGFAHIASLACVGASCTPEAVRLFAGVILMLILFMFNAVLAIGAAVVAAPAVASDIDSGIMLAILPRPLARWEVITGKWLALCFALILYAGFFVPGEVLLASLTTCYVPPHPRIGLLYLCAEGVSLLTLSLLASTRWPPLAVGMSIVILYGVAWIAGIIGVIGQALSNSAATTIGTVASLIIPTDGLWRGALYCFEPLAIVLGTQAVRNNPGNAPFLVFAPPTPAYVIWSALWIVAMLLLGIRIFSNRDM